MDQTKIGKFIADCRKEKNMTQRQLADRLEISDKTVSKWECGKGLPDVSYMIPLCEQLDINVNELLTGERLTDDNYQEKAEETMMELVKEREYTKTYKGLAVWMISFVVLSLFWLYQYYAMENTDIFVKISLTTLIIKVDFLFLDIYRGEYVYWIAYGPDFCTAKEAGTKARKKYAGQYLKSFLIASAIWTVYIICSIIFDLSIKTDFITCLLIMVTAGLCTIPIKFGEA